MKSGNPDLRYKIALSFIEMNFDNIRNLEIKSYKKGDSLKQNFYQSCIGTYHNTLIRLLRSQLRMYTSFIADIESDSDRFIKIILLNMNAISNPLVSNNIYFINSLKNDMSQYNDVTRFYKNQIASISDNEIKTLCIQLIQTCTSLKEKCSTHIYRVTVLLGDRLNEVNELVRTGQLKIKESPDVLEIIDVLASKHLSSDSDDRNLNFSDEWLIRLRQYLTILNKQLKERIAYFLSEGASESEKEKLYSAHSVLNEIFNKVELKLKSSL